MSEESSIKIRVRSGESEAEIEASLHNIREAIELIPQVLSKLPVSKVETRPASARATPEVVAPQAMEPASMAAAAPASPSSVPTVTIEKGDSLSDVISKFFSDPWGRSPRKLMEVREALQSYGLNYPKQSVAVALLRLAKGSKIRRFKGESGEYVYTASTGVVRIAAPVQSFESQHAPEVEPSQALQPVEEQLDLDAPSPN